MNISKFTQKSIEAVQNCEKVAEEFGNQEIDQEHLIYSLVNLEDSLILKLVEKMEIQTTHFKNRRVLSYVGPEQHLSMLNIHRI